MAHGRSAWAGLGVALALLGGALGACGGSSVDGGADGAPADAVAPDTAPDAGGDAGADAATDAAPDAPAAPDGAADTAMARDAGADATPDAAPDGGADAAPDAGPDAGAPDTAPDSGPDAGTDATVDALEDAAAAADAGSPGPPRFTVVVIDPVEAAPFSAPLGVSPAGDVVGYFGAEAWSPDARPLVVRADGTVVVLPTDSAEFGFAWGLSSPALAVGSYLFRPQAWQDGVRVPLGVPEGWFSGSAQAVNAAGLVVGSFAGNDDALPPNPVGPRPCAWTALDAEPTRLRPFPDGGPLGDAWDVNAAGVIAGTVATPDGFRPAVWTAVDAAPAVIGPFEGALLGEARGINARGLVTGRVTLEGGLVSRGFVGTVGGRPPTLLPFLDPAERYAEALDVDDADRVVGTARVPGAMVHAVLWVDEVAYDLNDLVTALPEDVRYLSSAVGIAASGAIAAEAVMDEGFGDTVRRIAVLRPVP